MMYITGKMAIEFESALQNSELMINGSVFGEL